MVVDQNIINKKNGKEHNVIYSVTIIQLKYFSEHEQISLDYTTVQSSI